MIVHLSSLHRTAVIILSCLASSCFGAAGSPVSKGGAPELYVRMRDHIAHDSGAAHTFGLPLPLSMRVWDTLGCIPLPLSELGEVTGFLDSVDCHPRIRDASPFLDNLTGICGWRRDTSLTALSTAASGRYSLMFVPIDSTFSPSFYLVPAWLLEDGVLRRDIDDKGRPMADSTLYLSSAESILYIGVFDRNGELVRVATIIARE